MKNRKGIKEKLSSNIILVYEIYFGGEYVLRRYY